jgi:hypothetical protein
MTVAGVAVRVLTMTPQLFDRLSPGSRAPSGKPESAINQD